MGQHLEAVVSGRLRQAFFLTLLIPGGGVGRRRMVHLASVKAPNAAAPRILEPPPPDRRSSQGHVPRQAALSNRRQVRCARSTTRSSSSNSTFHPPQAGRGPTRASASAAPVRGAVERRVDRRSAVVDCRPPP